jgi:hypothetical protein
MLSASSLSRKKLLLLAFAVGAIVPFASAAKPDKAEKRAARRAAVGADSPATGSAPAAESAKTKPAPEAAQARTLDRLRTKLEVPDDAEWSVISARIARVEELQRTLWTNSGNRGGLTLNEKSKGNASSSNRIDRDALRSALNDKLPDAEIKARLSHAHDTERQNEAVLTTAQTELRAVLTVRQEALLVVAGLLPP